jgi:enoyl-CoA hydratase
MEGADVYGNYKSLKFERRGMVLTVTMNNPPLNAATAELHDELSCVFYDVARDPKAQVVVLTGAGSAFSAGGDIKAMEANLGNAEYHTALFSRAPFVVHGLLGLNKVVIARINGHAMGLGATLALLCDLTIAAETAKIADPHVLVALSAGDGGSFIWPQHIGFARARWFLLTGEAITAKEAVDIGLINKAVPAEELDEAVYELADRLAKGPTLALNATKRSINMLLKKQAEGLVEAQLGMEMWTIFSKDHAAAVRAFLDKKSPVFEGR